MPRPFGQPLKALAERQLSRQWQDAFKLNEPKCGVQRFKSRQHACQSADYADWLILASLSISGRLPPFECIQNTRR